MLTERKLERLVETVQNVEKLDDISKLTRPLRIASLKFLALKPRTASQATNPDLAALLLYCAPFSIIDAGARFAVVIGHLVSLLEPRSGNPIISVLIRSRPHCVFAQA